MKAKEKSNKTNKKSHHKVKLAEQGPVDRSARTEDVIHQFYLVYAWEGEREGVRKRG